MVRCPASGTGAGDLLTSDAVRGGSLVGRPITVMGPEPAVVSGRPATHPVELRARIDKWSGRKDLNLRPPGPEPGALARLRYAPTVRHLRARNTHRDTKNSTGYEGRPANVSRACTGVSCTEERQNSAP